MPEPAVSRVLVEVAVQMEAHLLRARGVSGVGRGRRRKISKQQDSWVFIGWQTGLHFALREALTPKAIHLVG
jgi:hypothetical protein